MNRTFPTALLVAVIGAAPTPWSPLHHIHAQDDDFESSLDSDEIDIDGSFEQPTAADRRRRQREQLEREHSEMVDKKIEDMRIKEERKIGRKLKKAFRTGNFKELSDDEEGGRRRRKQAAQSAPPAPKPASEMWRKNAVHSRLGFFSFQGEAEHGGKADVDFNSRASLGTSIETLLSEGMVLSVGFTYITMEVEDGCDPMYGGGFGYYQPGYGNWGFYGGTGGPAINRFNCRSYLGFYGGGGRTIEYSGYTFDMVSKILLRSDEKIRPYIGFGMAYTKATLNYENNDPWTEYPNLGWGNEVYSMGYLSGIGVAGGEISLTPLLGIGLEFRYAKSLTDLGGKSRKPKWGIHPDRRRLENVGDSIQSSHQVGIFASLMVKF